MTWKLFDPTGDLGVDARATALESLFAHCARAGGADAFPVAGLDPAEELRDFLSEILYRFSAERKRYGSSTPGSGTVEGAWEPYDSARHSLRTERKAVPWRPPAVGREEHGWKVRVIFDV